MILDECMQPSPEEKEGAGQDSTHDLHPSLGVVQTLWAVHAIQDANILKGANTANMKTQDHTNISNCLNRPIQAKLFSVVDQINGLIEGLVHRSQGLVHLERALLAARNLQTFLRIFLAGGLTVSVRRVGMVKLNHTGPTHGNVGTVA